MQKAIIVRDDNSGETLESLNIFLKNGWNVVKMCNMDSSRSGGRLNSYETKPTCLVILEKD